jgi:hypothetical protein
MKQCDLSQNSWPEEWLKTTTVLGKGHPSSLCKGVGLTAPCGRGSLSGATVRGFFQRLYMSN